MLNAFGKESRKITPLKVRATQVLGVNGPALLRDLEYAHWNSAECEKSFDRYARRILSRCAKLEGHAKERRRRGYVRACIKRLMPIQPRDRTVADDLVEDDAVVAFAEAVEMDRRDVLLIGAQLAAVIYGRGGDTPSAVLNILRKAATKRHPLLYLRRLVENEEAKCAPCSR